MSDDRKTQRMYLDRLLRAYADGQRSMDNGRNPVSADIVAHEIVNRYRPYLNDKNGVSHDGPAMVDIRAALIAAEQRGRKDPDSNYIPKREGQ